MTRYILNQLLRNKILLVWPGLFFAAFFLFMIYATTNHVSGVGYVFEFGELIMPAEMIMSVLTGIVVLVVLIALPTHLIINTEPGRASLLLTKPISRTDFFISDLSAVAIITIAYSIFSILLFALFFLIKGTVFPGSILMGLAVLPLTVLAYYINILLLGLLFKNYLLTVFFCYILAALSNFLFSAGDLFAGAGIELGSVFVLMDTVQYLIPGVGPASAMSDSFFRSAGQSIDLSFLNIGLLAHYFVSLIPFTGWAFYIMKNRQF